MRYIIFGMIAAGGIIMTISAIKYSRLLRNADGGGASPKRAPMLELFSRLVMAFFILGYIVGALHVLLREVEPIFYFVGVVFFLASIFALLIMQNLEIKTKTISEKNMQLQVALEQIAAQNAELQSQVESRVHEIIKQDKLLQTSNEVAAILLASDVGAFDDALWSCMGKLAACVAVDRMYIWKNHVRDGQLRCTQLYEWSEEAEPQQGNALTVDISYDESIPGWEQTLSGGRSVKGLVRNLSPAEREQLEPQGIISILVVPVFLQDRFWGFVGFDDCRQERTFSDVEEGILRSASLLIATALLRNEMVQNLMQAREEALSSSRAKGDFLSSMSHEIRTPINAITGMATIARRADEITKVHDCLDKIDAASRQLLGVINDILDMSKIESGKMELASAPFPLHTALHNVKSIVEVPAAEKRLAFTLDIAQDVPQVAIGDDMRLSQVLLNLLSNAVKFTPEGGSIRLGVRLLERQGDACVLEAQIQDNGIGMDEEQQKRLFQAFEQADRNTARNYGGTGLGLAISKRMIEMMEGDIRVVSAPGQGSCFTVTFRLLAGNEAMLRTAPGAAGGRQDFSGISALLVEDIAINREIAMALLQERGLQVHCAENGQEALELFAGDPEAYDIIFMDVHMPVMDGYDATRAIRAMDVPAAKKVPIIAMTANAFEDDVRRCLDAGMDGHIAKPVDEAVVFKLIAQYCARGLQSGG